MPGHNGPEWDTFEAFQAGVCRQPWFQPAGQCVAVDIASGEWVGLCAVEAVRVASGAVVAYNLDTGVERTYRGRGIAQALKVLGLRYAQAQGAREVRTNVHPQNAPMLAINQKLGYRVQSGHYRMQKALTKDLTGAWRLRQSCQV
jgi:RimJ/RimL family protein N-acetyltransferase